MKNYKTLALLGVLLVALTTLVYWDNWQTKKDEKVKESENKLVEFSADKVVSIDYESEASEGENGAKQERVALTLGKTPTGEWEILSPISSKASSGVVEELIATFLNYKYEKKVGENNFAEFGLDKPQRKITLRFSNSETPPMSIMLGNKSPVGYNLYVATSASTKVYMGSQYFLVSTAKTIKDFRDKEIIKIESEKLTGLTYQKKPDVKIQIKKENNQYKIVEPAFYDADSISVEETISALNNARADDFIDNPSDELQSLFRPDESLWTVSLQFDKGNEAKIYFAKHSNALWASLNPAKLLIKMPADFEPKLNKSVFDFRDKKIFKFSSTQLTDVAFDGEKFTQMEAAWYKALDIQKDAKGLTTIKQGAMPESAIKSLLVDLTLTNALAFVDPKDAKALEILKKAPQHKIDFIFTKGEPMTGEFWPDSDSSFLVRLSNNNSMIYRAQKVILDAWLNKDKPKAEAVKSVPTPGGHSHDGHDHEG